MTIEKAVKLPLSLPRLAALLVLALGFTVSLPASAEQRRVDVIKSPSDARSYESLVLDNELKVLLISDPTTDKAAASLDVHVGSGSDPEGRDGLAHFLEHMLFLGTKKYPQAGEYKAFVNAHAGTDNAYTAFDHTNYYFDIDKGHLEPALDRFAQFFKAPLFTAKYVDRERTVVHSEYTSGKKNDGRRIMSARKQALNPRHPLVNFAVGNLETLADRDGSNIRDELIRFYREHYSANIMALVVIGKEPLDTLRAWVVDKFSGIENRNLPLLKSDQPLFEPGRLPARLEVVPIKEQRSLALTFPIATVREYWTSKPTMHISHLLGHEGKGSLLSVLKQKGWADGLSAGLGLSHADAASYNVSIALTEDGLEHVDDIVDHVFQYIELIRQKGIERWVFEENRKLANIGFQFEEKANALGYVRSLANDLHLFPAHEILRGHYALDTFHPGMISTILDQLRPDNLLLVLTAKGLDTSSKSPFYETEYELVQVDDQTLARWRNVTLNSELALPSPNEFVPNGLELKEVEQASSTPVKIKENPGFELWHRQDESFGLPRADFYFSVRSPIANDSARHAVLTELYVALVNDQLNEFSYPATLAGLSYSLYKHLRGFSVRISGYSDKQAKLVKRIVERLKQPEIDPQRFAIIKADFVRRLRNAQQDAPYTRALDEMRTLLVRPDWTDEELTEALATVDVNALETFYPQLLRNVYVVALAHGNLQRRDALALSSPLEATLLADAVPTDAPTARVVKLEPGTPYLRRIESSHSDSAVAVYFQGDEKDDLTRAEMALIAHIVSPPFFEELRTEKQLGYVVFSSLMTILESPALSFVVQSPQASSVELEGHVDAFIETFADTIDGMSEADFSRNKAGLLTQILQEDTKLQQRSDRYWTEIDRRHYRFDLRHRLAEAVRSITLEELRRCYRELLLAADRKRLVVRAAGKRENDADEQESARAGATVIEDPRRFKQDKALFPGYSS